MQTAASECQQIFRSTHQRCFVRKGVLRNFVKLKGKYLRQSLFLNKVTGRGPATLLKKRLWHRCFSVNFVKFLRTPFYRTPLVAAFKVYVNIHIYEVEARSCHFGTIMCTNRANNEFKSIKSFHWFRPNFLSNFGTKCLWTTENNH